MKTDAYLSTTVDSCFLWWPWRSLLRLYT